MNKTEWLKFFKFGLVGILNTLIDFAIFNLLLVWNCPPTVSKAFSYTAGMVNSFFWNRKWTFRSNRSGKKQFFLFLLLNLFMLLVSVGGMRVLSARIANICAGYPILTNNLANLLVMAVTMILNFTGSRFWIFRNKN